MSELRVACPECKAVLYHNCYGDSVKEAAEALLNWIPETAGFASEKLSKLFIEEGQKANWLDEGEDPFIEPFFGSQSWVYTLFEKDQARTFQALINNLLRAAGLDPHEVRTQAYEKIVAERKEKEEREKRREELLKKKKERYDADVCTRCGSAYNEDGLCSKKECGGTRKRADEIFGKK